MADVAARIECTVSLLRRPQADVAARIECTVSLLRRPQADGYIDAEDLARATRHDDAGRPSMSPEKLFDYLEGKFGDDERTAFEQRLAADPQLQRELEIAREIHRRARGSREVLGEQDPDIPQPATGLGRKLITAFAALVLLNVLVGIFFIIGKKKGTGELRAREEATRQQLASTLQRTAETSLPLPTIGNEIRLIAAVTERDRVADQVVQLAQQAGGSAAKAPPDDKGVAIVIDLPSTRADEFRQSLAPLAPPEYSPTPEPSPSADRRSILQVRVGDSPSSPTP